MFPPSWVVAKIGFEEKAQLDPQHCLSTETKLCSCRGKGPLGGKSPRPPLPTPTPRRTHTDRCGLESLSWAENSRNQIGPDIPNCGCEGPYVKGPPGKATAEQSRSSESLQAKIGDDLSRSGSHLCVDTYLTQVAFLLPQT